MGETESESPTKCHKGNVDVLKHEIKGFIEQIVNAVLQFYEI